MSGRVLHSLSAEDVLAEWIGERLPGLKRAGTHRAQAQALVHRLRNYGFEISEAAAGQRASALEATLRYLQTQARNGTLHPQVVIQNVDKLLGRAS